MAKNPKGPKRIAYALIQPESDDGRPMYDLLERLVAEHHTELAEARIALAWNVVWKPDVDGRVTLGKCKKASDLDRELAAYDFVIILRREFWAYPSVSDAQRAALLDHELMHATVKLDANGDPTMDTRGRTVYRIRKHDIEEFRDIMVRHGCWKRDLEEFAAAILRGPQQQLGLEAANDDDDSRVSFTNTTTGEVLFQGTSRELTAAANRKH